MDYGPTVTLTRAMQELPPIRVLPMESATSQECDSLPVPATARIIRLLASLDQRRKLMSLKPASDSWTQSATRLASFHNPSRLRRLTSGINRTTVRLMPWEGDETFEWLTDFDPDFVEVYDFQITEMNVYKGGPFQQAIS